LGGPIGNFLSGALDYGSLRSENQRLRDQVAALQQQSIQAAAEQSAAQQLLAEDHLPFVGTIFPTTSYDGRQPRGLCAWHPNSPTSTEGWRFFLVDKDAPKEAKDYLRRYYMRYSGPAGMTEQDDMENWNYASEASNGTIARRYPYSYQMGLGFEEPAGGLEGAIFTPGVSEQNQRGFYNRWAAMMDAGSWEGMEPHSR